MVKDVSIADSLIKDLSADKPLSENVSNYLSKSLAELGKNSDHTEVYKVLKSSGAVQFIGRENIFPGSISNPNLATKNALKRAQEIIGSSDIDVRIYHDPSRPTE